MEWQITSGSICDIFEALKKLTEKNFKFPSFLVNSSRNDGTVLTLENAAEQLISSFVRPFGFVGFGEEADEFLVDVVADFTAFRSFRVYVYFFRLKFPSFQSKKLLKNLFLEPLKLQPVFIQFRRVVWIRRIGLWVDQVPQNALIKPRVVVMLLVLLCIVFFNPQSSSCKGLSQPWAAQKSIWVGHNRIYRLVRIVAAAVLDWFPSFCEDALSLIRYYAPELK